MLNASAIGIRTRSTFAMWLLRLAVKLCGAEMRLWRAKPRKVKEATI
jgi:hypothetical protein